MEWAAIQQILDETGFRPRNYQRRIIEKVVNMFIGEYQSACGEFEPSARSVMIESPTGSGKTCMGLAIAKVLQRLRTSRLCSPTKFR
jgi:Rad3-related DNA helicase